MNKKDAAKNILFFLDDINDVRHRITGSEEIPELEIDMLRQQVLTLYQELNRYKRLTQEADNPQKAASYTPPQVKTEPRQAVVQEAPKPEPIKAEAPKREEASQPVMVKETPEAKKRKEKLKEAEPAKPEPQRVANTQDKISQAYAQVRTKQQEPKAEEKPEKITSSINEKFQSTTAQSSINERFAQQNVKTKLADKLKLSPISDLSKAISINQRVSFVKELFKGDEKEFKRVVAYVNSLRNFSEAKFFLESEVARQHEWNEESPKTQEFMELVFRKFL